MVGRLENGQGPTIDGGTRDHEPPMVPGSVFLGRRGDQPDTYSTVDNERDIRLYSGTIPAVPQVGEDTENKGSLLDSFRAWNLQRRLTRLARTLGKDFGLRLEPGAAWAYYFPTNTITYPVQEMLNNSADVNMGLICHELSHRLYSRVPSDSRIKHPAFHFLWNSIEDIRINKIISARYAGVPRMMKELYKDFTDDEARKKKYDKLAELGLQLPRSKQFGFAAIYEWASGGKPDPMVTDPQVLDALKEARVHIKEATRLPPDIDLRFDDLEGWEADSEAAYSFEVIRDKIWPIYKKLLDEDIEDGRDDPSKFDQGDCKPDGKPQQNQSGGQPDPGKEGQDPGEETPQAGEGQEKQGDAEKSEGAQGKQNAAGEAGASEDEQSAQDAGGKQEGGEEGTDEAEAASRAQSGGEQQSDSSQDPQGADGSQCNGGQEEQEAQGAGGGEGQEGQESGGAGQAQGQEGQEGQQSGGAGQAQGQEGQEGQQPGGAGQAQGQEGQEGQQSGGAGQAQGQEGQQSGGARQAQGQEGQPSGGAGQAQGQEGQQSGSQNGQGAQSGSQSGQSGEPGAGGSEDSASGSGQASGTSENQAGKSSSAGKGKPVNSENNQSTGGIDLDTLPQNPLATIEGEDARTQAAKKALEKSLAAGAKDLQGKIRDAEEERENYDPGHVPSTGGRSNDGGGTSKEREWETTGASGNNPKLGYDGDTDVDLDEMLRTYEEKLKNRDRQTNLTAWETMKKKYRREIQEMVDELTNFFERDDLPDLVGHFRGGVYDLRRAIQSDFRREATGKGDPKIFLKRDEPRERSVEIVFCIDCSGSMGNGAGSKMEYAREAFVVFVEALNEIGVGNGAVMFNSGVSILKPIDEDIDDTQREQVLGKLKGGGGNNDTAALTSAKKMLEDSDADQKIVIFLSDGAAVANHAQWVRQVEDETDIKVIGIGIGAGCDQVPTTYRHHLKVPDTSQLPRKLGDLLMDEIMGYG